MTTRRGPKLVAGALLLLGITALELPAAAQDETTPRPGVAVVGDSVAYFARERIGEQLSAAGRPAQVMAAVRATLNSSYDQMSDLVHRSDRPPIWVITLGHAEIFEKSSPFRARLVRVLDLLSPRVDCIRWFNVTRETTFYGPVNERSAQWNQMLVEEAARYPNVEVYHYAHWARLAPDRYIQDDGLHHSNHGEVEYGRMVRQAADGCDPATTSGPYWDVGDRDPAAGAVAWSARQRVVRGYPNASFRSRIGTLTPPLDRGTTALAAWRRAGSPRGYPAARWQDASRSLRPALNWISALGLAQGAAGRRFAPHRSVSRAFAIRLAWAASGSPTVEHGHPWTDAPANLRLPLRWLAASGDRNLFPGTQLHPGRTLTRAGLARLLAPPEAEGPLASPSSPPAPPSPPEFTELDEPPGPSAFGSGQQDPG